MRVLLIASLALMVSSCVAVAQTLCFPMSGGAVTGPGSPYMGANGCSLYPSGTVAINTSNTGDPNYGAWQTWLVAQASALPTYLSKYRTQIAKGLTLTSTGDPSTYNGTYPISDCVSNPLLPLCSLVVQAQLAKLNNTQSYGPGGATTVNQYDTLGSSHSFDRDHMIAWGAAIAGYLNNCSYQSYLSGGNSFPTNAVTIP